MKRQAVVIATSHSRRGNEAATEIPKLLRERGVEVIDIRVVEGSREACTAAKKAVKDGAKLIVICGGDGAQSRVAAELTGRDCTVGVVPAGTGNSFALGLGIADSFEAAADAIATGEEREVDLGTARKSFFANFLTVGLAAEVGEETPHLAKRILGPVAYGVAGLIPAITHKPFSADIRWKKHRIQIETDQIIVANGRFYGHQPLSPDASLYDGRLVVFARDHGGPFDIFETYLALTRGDQAKLSGVHLWSTDKTLTIETKPKVAVALDGDAFGKTPVRIGIARRALRVMVPVGASQSA